MTKSASGMVSVADVVPSSAAGLSVELVDGHRLLRTDPRPRAASALLQVAVPSPRHPLLSAHAIGQHSGDPLIKVEFKIIIQCSSKIRSIPYSTNVCSQSVHT